VVRVNVSGDAAGGAENWLFLVQVPGLEVGSAWVDQTAGCASFPEVTDRMLHPGRTSVGPLSPSNKGLGFRVGVGTVCESRIYELSPAEPALRD
jgi:hypothetical protein